VNKYRVRILRRAQADLIQIQAYIMRDRPDAAQELINRIFDRLVGLQTLPQRGAVPRDRRLRAAGYRFLLEGEYLIFYRRKGREVRIRRVLHGRRRYRHLL
jgi:toxin ParE1/3/4